VYGRSQQEQAIAGNIANCLGQLGMVFLKAIEQVELNVIHAELKALKAKIGVNSNAI
jgi:hypothetical protein